MHSTLGLKVIKRVDAGSQSGEHRCKQLRFSSQHHFCAQPLSNHIACAPVSRWVISSSLTDGCRVNRAAAVGGTQWATIDWWMLQKIAS